MDRKTEDRIARLAFGELTEAEAAQVRAMAGQDADTAKALDSYELLRSDLRQMRDVPPDQLSKERLQSAILAQGLKPRPVRHGFPWVWAPIATVAAALALVVFMRPASQQHIPSEIMAYNDAPTLNTDDETKYVRGMLKQAIEQTAAVQPAPEVEGPVAAATPAVTGATKLSPPRTSVRFRQSRAAFRPYAPVERVQDQPATLESSRLALKPAETFRAKAAVSQPKEPIVLIQTERDGNTGAKSAVEVQQTEDVIVSS